MRDPKKYNRRPKYMIEHAFGSGGHALYDSDRYVTKGWALSRMETHFKWVGPGTQHPSTQIVLNRMYEYDEDTDTWRRYPTQWDK